MFYRSERPAPPSHLENEVFDTNTAPPRLKSPSQVGPSVTDSSIFLSWTLCSCVDLTFSCASYLVMQDYFFFIPTCSRLIKFSCFYGLGKLIEKKTVSENYLNKTAGCAKLSLKQNLFNLISETKN